MSQYTPRLQNGNGINWPDIGTWQQETDVNLLSTFAANLDVSQTPVNSDLLSSVPAPWARLLLFENALFDSRHPSHSDITDQWRGMLGLIALAAPLGIRLDAPTTVDIRRHASPIARTFLDLRPQYLLADGRDQEAAPGKWEQFQLLSIGGRVLGATSPRTLIFTGVGAHCPSSVPFAVGGRLADPARYYREFGDQRFLGMLAYWLNGLIAKLQNNQDVSAFLGQLPAARGAGQHPRLGALLECLQAWQRELGSVQSVPVPESQSSVFTLPTYNLLNGLASVETGESDLYLRGRNDIIIGYRSAHTSKVYNASEFELQGEPLRVYDGHWVRANKPLPSPLGFIPEAVSRLEDPSSLFEERLLDVILPNNPEAVYYLEVSDGRRFLFPFRREILDFLSPEEVARFTQISKKETANSIRVELKLPLPGGRMIIVVREYSEDREVLHVEDCDRLAKWPDFVCPTWHRYFYFKQGLSSDFLNFTPVGAALSRRHGNLEWYVAEEPLRAFVGRADTHQGLLLLRQPEIPAPSRFWRIAVDFGSTHTRAFSLEVDKQGDDYFNNQMNTIQPVTFRPRAKLLTAFGESDIISRFFDFGEEEERRLWLNQEELYTLLMQPMPNAGTEADWLPREGFVYKRSVLKTLINPENLKQDLKWNSNREDFDLRAFLRCLLLMTHAEACAAGAQVVSVAHTHPSVFTSALVGKHNDEWLSLQEYLGRGRGVQNVTAQVLPTRGINETVAVCKHLENEQGAVPSSNTISLDVGGSTTDMAVWGAKAQGAGGELKRQESVKMAAGIVGRYLDVSASKTAEPFLKWLIETVNKKPYEANINPGAFAKHANGFGLMFNTLLSTIDRKGHLPNFIDRVNGTPEARPLVSHIMYLFSGLTYYAGVLTRAGLASYADQAAFYIYFCGRGGKLVEWVEGYREMVTEMFLAGLYRGGQFKQPRQQTVEVRVSSQPKEEVGRGLLADNTLEGNPNRRLGLENSSQPTVTTGETGYHGLEWDKDLRGDDVLSLPANSVPPMQELKELNAFLNAFYNNRITGAAAEVLDFPKVTSVSFENNLKRRLFGDARGCVVSDLRRYRDDALLEPLFITELKVWLETATGNNKIFR